MPSSEKPLPLLVVLHGDREKAATAAKRWKTKDFVVLSLQCPRDKGCKGSWWQWDGDPQWIRDQIAAVKANIDPARIYAAGWSGGATYLGMRSTAWSQTFAAIVIHGGGMRPSDDACGPVPMYFLVGDKNPLHHLAVGLRQYAEGCNAETRWDLVRGAAHAGEARALTTKKAQTVLEWLRAHAITLI